VEVICLESDAFYALIDEVITRLREIDNQQQDKWIQDQEVMRMLGVKSKVTLQKLRDERKIRFSQPQKRIILYDRESVLEYIETHANETF